MRSALLSYLTTALSTATIKVSQELPWNTAGEPLYIKNMKKLYLDEDQVEETVLIPVLDGNDIISRVNTVRAYLAVDAKNQPSGLSTILATILGAKNQTGIVNNGNASDYTTDIQDDVIIYTVEFRQNTTL